ncbi:hypothetical protein KFL_003890220 [Klebsormidium nitens]|uniref:Uncharacterized protein n=1 Tax=Klebsormidium nitens TaxID=105231 RepID=A0A1Y1IFR4_KLENI|nr:hypothetical protein KFL_003890220 [Klebsormidium nitens]|eukprot:GAQ87951.1 hypothetical protein KFL_003890220 [Klebsormidium nitens]
MGVPGMRGPARQQQEKGTWMFCVGLGHMVALGTTGPAKRQHGMDTWRSCAAAKAGDLHILQWARANDCPWIAQECIGSPHPHIVLWVLNNSNLNEISSDQLKRAAFIAAREDDVGSFQKLRAFWASLSPLYAGPRCARLARSEGIQLRPDSEEQLRRVLARQVAAGVVLKRFPKEVRLLVFRMADFLWVPTGAS